MLNVFYKYLLLNKNAGIPGVGNFSVSRTSAQFNGTSFHPSTSEILFEQGTALTDKNFYHFLAKEKNISEVDAVRKFQDFAYQLRKDIQSNSFVELSGIGVLKKNNGEIIFESTAITQKYFPVITPTLVKKEEQTFANSNQDEEHAIFNEEEAVAKDRWWIWATVLAILAIAAITYFYWQESL